MKMRFTVVSSNLGKVREFQAIFDEYGLAYRVERMKTREAQSLDLTEIAAFSVAQAYRILREPVMVEDSGLFIHSLNGFPGPYTSYVYSTIGIEGVLRLMASHRDRKARFVSVIAFYSPYTGLCTFVGNSDGTISSEARGSGGFGFDPIFIPEDGSGKTFAEMSLEEKNRVSHRGRAARKFAEWLTTLRELPPPYVDIR